MSDYKKTTKAINTQWKILSSVIHDAIILAIGLLSAVHE